jgi:hypothetical protein
VCVCVRVCLYIGTYVRMYVCTYVCMYLCMYDYVLLYVCIDCCMYGCMYGCKLKVSRTTEQYAVLSTLLFLVQKQQMAHKGLVFSPQLVLPGNNLAEYWRTNCHSFKKMK